MHLGVPLPPDPMEELERNKRLAEQKLGGKVLYDLRKRQKEQAKKKERVKGKMSNAPKKVGKYIIYILIAVGIIGGLSWGATRLPNLPPTVQENHSENIPSAHILTERMPDRIQRHMLEHADGSGDPSIIIQYNCDYYECESEMVDQLTILVEEYPDNVYLAPNNYDGKIILTKLGRRKILDRFDAQIIRDFIE